MTFSRIRNLTLLGLCLSVPAVAGDPAALIRGLDHIPLAVADLEGAAANFGKLGFLIKPGRPHGNGLRNQHIKFPNGEGIELMTVRDPTDSLAREYDAWLKGGDGPAFWSIYSADLAALTTRLSSEGLDPLNEGHVVTIAQGPRPHRFFFGDRLRSPSDGPQYWAHPNTAIALKGVWLANGADEEILLVALGAVPAGRESCSPFTSSAMTLAFPGEDDEVIFARGLERAPERTIVGATVTVQNLATARKILERNKVAYVAGCQSSSVWIAPTEANGLWLEMRE